MYKFVFSCFHFKAKSWLHDDTWLQSYLVWIVPFVGWVYLFAITLVMIFYSFLGLFLGVFGGEKLIYYFCTSVCFLRGSWVPLVPSPIARCNWPASYRLERLESSSAYLPKDLLVEWPRCVAFVFRPPNPLAYWQRAFGVMSDLQCGRLMRTIERFGCRLLCVSPPARRIVPIALLSHRLVEPCICWWRPRTPIASIPAHGLRSSTFWAAGFAWWSW